MTAHLSRCGALAAVRVPLYGARYIVRRRVLGRENPPVRGLVLTNRCNLQRQGA
jgi:hypothetical protein